MKTYGNFTPLVHFGNFWQLHIHAIVRAYKRIFVTTKGAYNGKMRIISIRQHYNLHVVGTFFPTAITEKRHFLS